MERLIQSDLRALLEFTRSSYAVGNLDDFVDHLLSHLPALVPSEATVYNEYNCASNRIVWRQCPVNFAPPGSERIWEAYAHEHPILLHLKGGTDGGAVRFSDLVTPRQFARTHLYNEFFRPLGLRHQITFNLQDRPGMLICLALNRARRDFSDRERLMLNLLRPQLIQAYRNAEAVGRLGHRAKRLEAAIESLNCGVIFLKPNGSIEAMTGRAELLLSQYFAGDRQLPNRLPQTLAQWLRSKLAERDRAEKSPNTAAPLLLRGQAALLRIRVAYTEQQTLLILEVRRRVGDASVLERLGLAHRQAEVLFWLAQGKSNDEIGVILGTSRRTIEKQMEQILDKLAVENRTAAAAIAIEALHNVT